MAFQGETAAVLVGDGVVGAGDLRMAYDKPTVARADARRVKIALVLMLAVAVADCLLYLPRLF